MFLYINIEQVNKQQLGKYLTLSLQKQMSLLAKGLMNNHLLFLIITLLEIPKIIVNNSSS